MDPGLIQAMMRQIRRWHAAAVQDAHPGIQFLHASYGQGVLDMLRQLASDTEILTATGVDARMLHWDLATLQDTAQQLLMAGD